MLARMGDVFDTIGNWLLDQAMDDSELADTLSQLAHRLVGAGVPLARIKIGRVMLHPVIGVMDLTWEAATDRVETETMPRAAVNPELFMSTPFGQFTLGKASHIRADLTCPEQSKMFAVFEGLVREGATDYAAWGQMGSQSDVRIALPNYDGHLTQGISVSIATKRLAGFSDRDIAGFERLLKRLFVSVRVASERYLARTLLETYLGRRTGARVLNGKSARGDGETIDCVILYSDMRNSTALSQSLDQNAYLEAVNRYFDCVAGAVTGHGGEVLKFVGDGVLSIFPVDADLRPLDAMCDAALSAAREAFGRARQIEDGPEFGIALHFGRVVYGNVGTPDRLDYTATGHAVSLACRCEALTRELGCEIIATAAVAENCHEPGDPLGTRDIRGVEGCVQLFGYRLPGAVPEGSVT